MKKLFFLLAAMTLFVSCANVENVADVSGGGETGTTSQELTLSTMANQTRAIAEGTNVPTDNVIGFYPYFRSDISSSDYSVNNKYGMFGYDSEQGVWRNVDPRQPLRQGLPARPANNDYYSPVLNYNFSPVYWPAGDRVFMDYTACSYSFVLSNMLSEAETKLMLVEPVFDNSNRMSIIYKYNVLNGPLVSSALLTLEELTKVVSYLRTMYQLGYISESNYQYLSEELGEYFLPKYGEAIQYFQETLDFDNVHYLLGNDEKELRADAKDVLNRGYWFFMNYAPMVYKFLQDDLMYAHDRYLQNDNHGSVKAVFNHAKAWVKVIINNQTNNDFYVENIKFDDVKSNGTLIIDNSKSSFESYWDFSREENSKDVVITPYSPVSLDGSSIVTPTPDSQSSGSYGMLPDQYIVPSGCYGPALNVTKRSSYPVTSLTLNYLNGSKAFNLADNDCKTMVSRLSGMMFPAQEPGKITIKYTFWPKQGSSMGVDYTTQQLPMNYAVEELPNFGPEYTREVSLNLPRLPWQMGKVYVYVLTIGEDEITIDPAVTEWEYADPIIGPVDDEQPSEDDSQIEDFGSNQEDPNWGWEFK